MLDSIIGQPTQNNTDHEPAQPVLDDDVFASILGYMAPIPTAPVPVETLLEEFTEDGLGASPESLSAPIGIEPSLPSNFAKASSDN